MSAISPHHASTYTAPPPGLTYDAAACFLVREVHVLHHAVVIVVKRCCADGGPPRGGEGARRRRLRLVIHGGAVQTRVVQLHAVERGLGARGRRRVCGRRGDGGVVQVW